MEGVVIIRGHVQGGDNTGPFILRGSLKESVGLIKRAH